MKLFGIELFKRKSAVNANAVMETNRTYWGMILESFAGAWQQAIVLDGPREILAFSAVYSCVTTIAGDVSKLRVKLVQEANGIWREVTDRRSPFLAVLKKPNHFQTRIKFIEQWVVSKLLNGNAYILKERDNRGIVVAMYVLDPLRVTTLVAPDGGVYYRLSCDELSGLPEEVTVPAREIIHDMMVSFWHPLVGVSPLYACAAAATQGNRIQRNSSKFFENMSRPSGMLTAPNAISNETADRLKASWESNFGGQNIGRLAVLGDGLKYEAMTIPATEAQLIEQLQFTVEDVARAFHMPMYKLGGPAPAIDNIEAVTQTYYSDCLQSMIESIELCLDEGLKLPDDMGTEFDLEGLIRMDSSKRMELLSEGVKAAVFSPNEARAKVNLAPVAGGETPYLQQQNFSLAALAKRDASEDPFKHGSRTSAPAANDDAADAVNARDLGALVERGLG